MKEKLDINGPTREENIGIFTMNPISHGEKVHEEIDR